MMLGSGFEWDTGKIAMVLIFGLPIVSVIATYWFKVTKTQSENALKQAMVERGMSAEEIERVLSAKAPKG